MIRPSFSVSETGLRVASAGATRTRSRPKRTPETIRTLAVARAVTPLVGRKFEALPGAGNAGPVADKIDAARKKTEPDTIGHINQSGRHGYHLIYYCPEMDRSFGVASKGSLC
jgi:hypothetical protein